MFGMRAVRWSLFSALLVSGSAGCTSSGQMMQVNKVFSGMSWPGGAPSGQFEPEVVVGTELQSEDDVKSEQAGRGI